MANRSDGSKQLYKCNRLSYKLRQTGITEFNFALRQATVRGRMNGIPLVVTHESSNRHAICATDGKGLTGIFVNTRRDKYF